MKKGLLIYNRFLESEALLKMNQFLIKSCKIHELELIPCSNADFTVSLDKMTAHSPYLDESVDFIIYRDKDIPLAKCLEHMGYRLFNSASAIELCDDKSLTAMKLSGIVSLPKTIMVPKTFPTVGYPSIDFLSQIEKELSYPFVIKECFGSFGMQVYLAENSQKAQEILQKHAGLPLICQQYIKSSYGRDIRIHIVGNQMVTAMLRTNPNDFRANAELGALTTVYTPSEEEVSLCLKVTKALGLDFAGIDLLFEEDGTKLLCEVNSNAHFTHIYECTGINVADAIAAYIASSI